ncbi:hypothetical protein CP533_6066 [Ophiocordyceps camponoti-saundersi (nom. inval.)]|nr:hypothetical protein CP533_6066 [Ophiocordyceps camponoti-saundersi (nom. inval.)]
MLPAMVTNAEPHIDGPQASAAANVALAHGDGKRHLLLAMSGSVAAIKIVPIINGLAHHSNLSIRLIFTEAAAHFLGGQSPEQPTLAEVRRLPNVDAIYADSAEWTRPWVRGLPILHIELRRWADVLVVSPLSANTMAKMVAGMCDNLLLSVIRAWDSDGSIDGVRKKIVVACAMNTAMWRHPVTASHLRTLEEDWGGENGWVEVLRPVSKMLACNDVGDGAMVSWETIVAVAEARLGLPTGGVADDFFLTHCTIIDRKRCPPRITSYSTIMSRSKVPTSKKGTCGDEACSSSTLIDPACSSTLRARLRSQEPTSQPFATLQSDSGAEVFGRFRACFSLEPVFSSFPQAKDTKNPLTIEAGAMAQLGDTFAEAGLRFYTAIAEDIVQARRDMDSEIMKLTEESTALLSRADALYSNITYPLCVTLCHIDSGPSATIAAHLSALIAKLSAAQGELEGFQREWNSCVSEEQQTWTELKALETMTLSRVPNVENDAVKAAVERFKKEAEAVIEAKEVELEEIDAELKELMQGETLRMMQSMMAN